MITYNLKYYRDQEFRRYAWHGRFPLHLLVENGKLEVPLFPFGQVDLKLFRYGYYAGDKDRSDRYVKGLQQARIDHHVVPAPYRTWWEHQRRAYL